MLLLRLLAMSAFILFIRYEGNSIQKGNFLYYILLLHFYTSFYILACLPDKYTFET